MRETRRNTSTVTGANERGMDPWSDDACRDHLLSSVISASIAAAGTPTERWLCDLFDIIFAAKSGNVTGNAVGTSAIISYFKAMEAKKVDLLRFSSLELQFINAVTRHLGSGKNVLQIASGSGGSNRRQHYLMEVRNYYYDLLRKPRHVDSDEDRTASGDASPNDGKGPQPATTEEEKQSEAEDETPVEKDKGRAPNKRARVPATPTADTAVQSPVKEAKTQRKAPPASPKSTVVPSTAGKRVQFTGATTVVIDEYMEDMPMSFEARVRMAYESSASPKKVGIRQPVRRAAPVSLSH